MKLFMNFCSKKVENEKDFSIIKIWVLFLKSKDKPIYELFFKEG
jgi:hypothetical protein